MMTTEAKLQELLSHIAATYFKEHMAIGRTPILFSSTRSLKGRMGG